jgi:tetratricopeptide (TPR) repeat protein
MKGSRKRPAVTARPVRKPAIPREESFKSHRYFSLLIPILIVIATCLVFAPALQNGFVSWDDDKNILENLNFRGLGWTRLQWMFTTFYMGHYQPLSWLTLAIDYSIWRLDPFGYHLTNIILHAANAALFYFLVVRLLRLAFSAGSSETVLEIRLAAAVAALFFALHPLRVESVAWVTERRDVLSTLFLIATLIFYLRAQQPPEQSNRWRWIGLAWVTYLFSLLAKAAGITFPVVLVLLDTYPLRRIRWLKGNDWVTADRAVWLEKIPFAVLASAAAIAAALAQSQSGTLWTTPGFGFSSRLLQSLYGLNFYLWKTLLPLDLAPLYEIPHIFDPLAPSFVISFVVITTLSLFFVAMRNRWPAGLTAWLCYITLVAPVLGLVRSGPQLAADRYSYLSCLGWAVLAGSGMYWCWIRWRENNRIRTVFSFGSLLIVASLALVTWNQIKVWRSSEALWRRVLEVDPNSSIAHNNWGNVLLRKGEFKAATDYYLRALEIDPAYAEAHFNLGTAYVKTNQWQAAVEQYVVGLKLDPNNAQARHFLGQMYVRGDDLGKAIEQFSQSLSLAPGQSVVHADLGVALALQGNFAEAVRELEFAISLRPNDAELRVRIGRVFAAQNRLREAVEAFRFAVQLDPEFAEAHLNLSQALEELGDRAEASHHFHEATRLKYQQSQLSTR